jgi:crotonobetainyl-CoA:carnitine CoA-transferase CaiB-like acyl-CoA transferase
MERALNAAELIALLDDAWATKTLDEWKPLFDAEPDMFWSPVQDPFEVVNDPTLRDAGGIVDVPDGVGTTPMIATPVDFHGTPWSPRGLAPELGEHTDEVLGQLSSGSAT